MKFVGYRDSSGSVCSGRGYGGSKFSEHTPKRKPNFLGALLQARQLTGKGFGLRQGVSKGKDDSRELEVRGELGVVGVIIIEIVELA